jgi:hypothetical protein
MQKCCQGQGCIAQSGCCTANDCNDNVACTTDACAQNTCTNTPNNAYCSQNGMVGTCDRLLGCVECTANGQCDDTNKCTQDICQNGRCVHLGAVCQVGVFCCPGTGMCSQCCSDCDCNGIIAPQSSDPQALPPACGICVNGMCLYSSVCTC